MAKPLLPLLILFSCLVAAAQDNALVCPTINIIEPEQRDIFLGHAELTVELSGGFQPTGYEWTISRGAITEGIGTKSIKVDFSLDDDRARFDAEVRVRGVPEGCEERAKLGFWVDLNSGSDEMLDEFGELPDNDFKARLDAAYWRLRDHPEFILYFVIYASPGNERQFAEFKRKIEDHLFIAHKIDAGKLQILHNEGDQLSIRVYLKPDGETSVMSAACPRFSITGPAGISKPGDPIAYAATIEGVLPRSAKLVWSVNQGQIIEGWGTERIVVTVDRETLLRHTLITTLEIVGLPHGCVNSATESLSVETVDPILIDEFPGENVSEIDWDRLADAVREGVNNPTNQLYIIEYFPPWTSDFDIREKIERIRRYIADELKFDISHVTIVTAEGAALNTKIYRVPPGAESPKP